MFTACTYIDEPFMIDVLLNHDWIVMRNTWTDCNEKTYNKLKHDYLMLHDVSVH